MKGVMQTKPNQTKTSHMHICTYMNKYIEIERNKERRIYERAE